jgi:hypothetical protein
VQTYRGLVMRVQVYRDSTRVARLSARWGYDVCVDDEQPGVRVWGPLHHVTPYGSHDAAELAGLQRGRIAIDMLLGRLLGAW